ncbi:MAG TPA: GGDEF domain-containing protein [Steroidobacteraceae bacterium]|nr:GGDEF domain-containing protein [Steroidobacteraceae bacterium]
MATDHNNKKGLLLRLLLGSLADAPPRVRERMIETIPTNPLSLAFYTVTLMVICATTVYVTRATWAWAWLTLSAVLVVWRALLPVFAPDHRQRRPLLSVMLPSGLAMASFGFGCALCLSTGDIALATMALSGQMGVLAGIATRWAVVPRIAIGVMTISVLPPILVLIAAGGVNVLAALSLGFAATVIASFIFQNREALHAAISSGEYMRRKAQTDHLTGLANRAELMQRMAHACSELPDSQERLRGRTFAVLYIDLDGFKAVNDSHGHAAGDEILQRVADGLRRAAGPDEVAARIGGDEFVVLLRDADALTARGVADEIIGAIAREHRLADGRAVRIGCSVGVCTAPEQGREPEVLLARADAALYEVKAQGKGHTGLWRAISDA